MAKKIIVNATAQEEIRVAIVEKNKLIDLNFESNKRSKQKGNIYKGVVANLEDSLEAAFIEFGEGRQGFLPMSEVRPSLFPESEKGKSRRKVKVSDVFTRGQEIVVQVTKDEIGNKGAALTSYLSLPGRYVVLMHSDESGGGISRKISDEGARKRARDLLSLLAVPDGMAVIIRTAGMNRSRIDLVRDLQALFKIWTKIDKGAELGRAPTILHREPDLVLRTIRDYYAADIEKIVIDNEDEYEEAKSYFEERMPDNMEIIERHTGKRPIFEHFGIEKSIEELFEREVPLKSGASIVIDQTEALVAIDVNSGKSNKEGDHETTVYKTNLEAAKEIGRQLRLRDLGGIVVIDFIDMNQRKHDIDIERALKSAMRSDKARVKIGRISANGTLELTRQRLRQAHRLISYAQCEACQGTGVIRDPAGLAIGAMRKIHTKLSQRSKKLVALTVHLPVAVANVVNNDKRGELVSFSEEHMLKLNVVADLRMLNTDIRFEEEERGKAGLEAAHRHRDPRANDVRRNGRGAHENFFARQTTPPPSIGQIPEWLLSEEEILKNDAEVVVETVAVNKVEQKAVVLDDPIAQLLFGPVLEMTLEDAECPENDRYFYSKKPKKARKKRRKTKKTDEVSLNENLESSADSTNSVEETAPPVVYDDPIKAKLAARREAFLAKKNGKTIKTVSEEKNEEVKTEEIKPVITDPIKAKLAARREAFLAKDKAKKEPVKNLESTAELKKEIDPIKAKLAARREAFLAKENASKDSVKKNDATETVKETDVVQEKLAARRAEFVAKQQVAEKDVNASVEPVSEVSNRTSEDLSSVATEIKEVVKKVAKKKVAKKKVTKKKVTKKKVAKKKVAKKKVTKKVDPEMKIDSSADKVTKKKVTKKKATKKKVTKKKVSKKKVVSSEVAVGAMNQTASDNTESSPL